MASEPSLRKIEANRKNAQKSTGPRTERGLAVVRLNALKHGFFSNVVVESSDGRGAKKIFNALLESLRQEFDPVGPTEELLVRQIAACWWKLERISACEKEEIELANLREKARQDHVSESKDRAAIEAIESLRTTLNDFLSVSGHEALKRFAARLRVRDSFYGQRFLIGTLLSARVMIEQGTLTSYSARVILNFIGDHARSFGLKFIYVLSPEAFYQPEEKLVEIPEERKCDLLKSLDAEVALLREEQMKLQAVISQKQRSTILPEPEILNHLSRYEASVERRLYRALAELERRQRARLGDFVPPPVKIEFPTQ